MHGSNEAMVEKGQSRGMQCLNQGMQERPHRQTGGMHGSNGAIMEVA